MFHTKKNKNSSYKKNIMLQLIIIIIGPGSIYVYHKNNIILQIIIKYITRQQTKAKSCNTKM